MLLNVPREEPAPAPFATLAPQGLKIGAVLSLILGAEMVWALTRLPRGWFGQEESVATVSSVAEIGRRLFTQHAFAFEATSILILVAMVGAVVLARREGPS